MHANISEIVEKFGGKGKFTKACAMNGWKTEGATKVTHASEDGGEDGGEDGLVSSGTKSLELEFSGEGRVGGADIREKLDAKTLVLRIVKTRGKSSSSRKNQNNNSSTNNNIQVEAFARCTKKIEFLAVSLIFNTALRHRTRRGREVEKEDENKETDICER